MFDKLFNCMTLNCISGWVGVWQDNNCCLNVYISVNCGWTRLPTVVLVHIERELLFDKIVVSCVSKCKLLFDEMSTVILLCYLACIVVLLVILLYINCFTHYLVWMLYSNSLCWYYHCVTWYLSVKNHFTQYLIMKYCLTWKISIKYNHLTHLYLSIMH